ncbi:52 kDa repressor of the inhibitor of the protein kinase-like [Aphis craccivora]|uniref:52 kDa repressor of the inhibitor of the protein kinase-like n=1 Tax=Aphis craccivora TaxID=307492 RepID=A0A6G0Y4B5_APHCR|nr:52 kDa repressor of the inhibitor of the protein kinase-like [Aphis craccivora]
MLLLIVLLHNKIVAKINKAKCFTVLADETTDVSSLYLLTTEIFNFSEKFFLEHNFFLLAFELRNENLIQGSLHSFLTLFPIKI